jgi:predicted transcriptional regulator
MGQKPQASLNEIRDELQIANRLMTLSLVRDGIQQKDVAATLGISESAMSKMFPKGLLKRIAQLSKSNTTGT